MGMPSPEEQRALGKQVGRGIGRAMEVVFSVFATAVFVVLWLYVAAAAFTDGALLADTWAWYLDFGLIGRVVVGVALLPLIVFLWAWQADLEPLWMGLLMLGLVAWTGLAISGLLRRPSRRRQRD
jgi:hypothetical protein